MDSKDSKDCTINQKLALDKHGTPPSDLVIAVLSIARQTATVQLCKHGYYTVMHDDDYVTTWEETPDDFIRPMSSL